LRLINSLYVKISMKKQQEYKLFFYIKI